ncbi:fatty acid hydroxylase superfamily-domain-containing protein [Aspergillus egyptiacus]|nr:fatty acid hydroxylase superfamily-domain-containing protein [Aspergillus egyptiacus]
MATNTSVVSDLPPLPAYTLAPRPPLIDGISDNILALIAPIVAYWTVSMFFHFIDVYDLFSQYRLHTPAELLTRNRVSRWDVIRDVVLQHVVQTVAGLILAYFDDIEYVGREEYDVAVWARRIRYVQRGLPYLLAMFGLDASGMAADLSKNGHKVLAGVVAGGRYPDITQSISESGIETVAPAFTSWELTLGSFIYWCCIPALQFFWAICVVDTWQYFLHRAMHLNRWLYVKFHSRHHRLYVPYAFGALYNHPVEGFLLDTVGAGIGFLTSGMTHRQSVFFFTVSTIKTVDDHCGYAFPWDPFQHMTANNAAYHDIHHQSWGIKTNFSQPFFIIWDRLFDTQWKGEVKLRYERSREAAQKLVDAGMAPESDADTNVVSEQPRQDAAVISPEETSDGARTRLRKKTATLSPSVDSLKSANHGVASSVL